MKKIKKTKLVFCKKSIVELTSKELSIINGGSSAECIDNGTKSIFTGEMCQRNSINLELQN